jgi:hypothetical protein
MYRNHRLLMEDIEIDDDRFMSFCAKFKYLGSYFVPELNDTGRHRERISQARKLFAPCRTRNYSATKDTDRYPMESIKRCCNIALGKRSWALKEQADPNQRSTMDVSAGCAG